MEQQWRPSFRPRFLETALCCGHWRAIPCFGVLCGFNGFEPRDMTNSGLLSTEMMPALLTEPYFRDAAQWNPLITSFCSSNLYFSQRCNSSLTCFKVFPLRTCCHKTSIQSVNLYYLLFGAGERSSLVNALTFPSLLALLMQIMSLWFTTGCAVCLK